MIKKITWNGLDAIEFAAGGYEALLVPSVGANVVKLKNTAKNADILRTPKPEDMETFASRPQIFGLPLLLPPNRIEDGRYTYNGRTYQFPITIPDQNNYHHGNIKSQPFTVTKCEEKNGEVEIEANYFSNIFNDEIYQYFPHEFECRMNFRLSARGLEHKVTFINLSATEMPIGVGYHTPLMVPFIPGGDASKYRLRVSVGKRWELGDRTLPTGNLLPLGESEKPLRGEGIVPLAEAVEYAFTTEPIEVGGKAYTGAILTDTASGTSVFYEVDKQMGHWTIWNNGASGNWICPEPQSWAINAPNVKLPAEVTGFQTVAPGKEWSSVSKIYVK